MGETSSKLIAKLETNIVDLIIKIHEGENCIDSRVKYHISKTLDIYEKQIDKDKQEGHISSKKAFRMKDLILRAKTKLDDMSIQETEIPSSEIRKIDLLEIKENMENNKIDEDQYRNVLLNVCFYAEQLNHKKTSNEDVSLLVLELFLKCPPITALKIQKNLISLDEMMDGFKNFDLQFVKTFELEETYESLKEMRKKLSDLNQKTLEKIQEIEGRIGLDNENESTNTVEEKYTEYLLKHTNDALTECEIIVGKLYPPVAGDGVLIIKNKIHSLMKSKFEILEENEELEGRKKFLSNKGMSILNRLEHIESRNKETNGHIKNFKEIFHKVLETFDSEPDFVKKITKLENCLQEVQDVSSKNSEVKIRKIEMVNKIECFITMEMLSHIRKIKNSTKYFRNYVQHFGFGENTSIYDLRRDEILDLAKFLEEISSTDSVIGVRVQQTRQEIDEVLEFLEDKANENQNICSILEQLDIIIKEISIIDQQSESNLTKLKQFNQLRKKVAIIRNAHPRIKAKKIEIFSQMNNIELQSFSENFGKHIQIKVELSQYESQLFDFACSNDCEEYYQKKNDISALVDTIKNIQIEGTEIANVLYETAIIISNCFDRIAKGNKDRNDKIKSLDLIRNKIEVLSKSDISPLCQSERLKNYEMIKHFCKKNGILKKIRLVENMIKIEKSKLEFDHMNDSLKMIKESIAPLTIPINPKVFKEHFVHLMSLKETVEDMPEGDLSLDSSKKLFLEEVIKVLDMLDSQVAKLVAEKKLDESFQLKNPLRKLDVKVKNVGQFVETVRNEVKDLGNCVNQYLGSDDLTDYKMLFRDLEDLEEVLSRLKCEDKDEAEEVEKIKKYINDLLIEIDCNASSS